MSKKIKISISNRPNLHLLFHTWLDRLCSEDAKKYDDFSYYDDETEYLAELGLLGLIYPDEGDFIFPCGNKRSKSLKEKERDVYVNYWDKEDRKRKRVRDAEFTEMGRRNRSKKNHRYNDDDLSIPFSGHECYPREIDDEVDNVYRIYFYPVYNFKDDRIEFESLKEFDNFCSEEGYLVPPHIAEDISYRKISHVCLNPIAAERGVKEVFASESYADMVYEVCDINELSQ